MRKQGLPGHTVGVLTVQPGPPHRRTSRVGGPVGPSSHARGHTEPVSGPWEGVGISTAGPSRTHITARSGPSTTLPTSSRNLRPTRLS